MFESDDFDQILSQLDLPEPFSNTPVIRAEKQVVVQDSSKCDINSYSPPNLCKQNISDDIIENTVENNTNKRSNTNKLMPNMIEEIIETSPKHSKRKLINSYFDHKTKRKFPGPAGLLNGTFEKSKEKDNICHVELLSQDIDYSENYLHQNIFNSPLWERLLKDMEDKDKVDSIKNVKRQALKGNLRHQKAEIITAYVERVDRSAKDPLVVLRDMSDEIKCTLHRDAWVAFSPYIVSECCALVLSSPTVLTTGSAFKRHYLNITLRNIKALYSSAIIKEDESFPTGFIKLYEEDYTIIRNEKHNDSNTYGTQFADKIGNDVYSTGLEDTNFFDGLDGAFSEDIF